MSQQSPDKLPALGQQRSLAANQGYGQQVDSDDDGLYGPMDQKPQIQKSMPNRTDQDGTSALVGQTGLQQDDLLEPSKDDDDADKGSEAGLSQLPVPKTADVPLPNVEIHDLACEDVLPDGSVIQWISRRDAGNYDDTQSLDDEKPEEKPEEEEKKEGAARMSTIDKLAKQKMDLQAKYEQNKNLLEVEAKKKELGAKSDQDIKPNPRFKYFNDAFSGLTRSKNVKTKYPIIDCIMTYNSKSAITITKKDDREHIINQYSLETYEMTFEEVLGGKPDSYIKVSQIEQNSKGDKFAVTYLDDGRFYLRLFGEHNRTDEREIFKNELDINQALNLNNHTMPIDNFPDPFITCVFVTDTLIFVNLFHNKMKKHFHFFYHTDTKEISTRGEMGQFTELDFTDSNDKNFPVKAFYNSEYNEIYSFYRQGQSFRVPVFEIESDQNYERANIQTTRQERKPDYTLEDIYDKDLGQMYLINETALVCRSSSQILFFKLEMDIFTGEKSWQIYHTLDFGGNIFFIKGTWRVQIVTDTKVYFYEIDDHTFEPMIRNVMNNYINCSMMLFGAKGKYGITYKQNEGNFDLYRAKYVHDFKVTIVHEDFDGSRGLPVESMKAFLVGVIDKIKFFDVNTFAEIKECEIEIPLFKSTSRERNEIISMQISPKEDILAVISGKKLIMDENKPNQIFIFKRQKNLNAQEDSMDQFKFLKRIKIMDNPAFEKISMQFKFQNTMYDRPVSHLLFARQDRIIKLNFLTAQEDLKKNDESISELAFFNMPLTRQPDYFLMSKDQSIAIIASVEDGIYFNIDNGAWIDLDELYNISLIKEIIHDDQAQCFYLLANKFEGKSGVFLIKFHELNPTKFNFFVKYKTKLDIADADIAIVRNVKEQFKELIVSYKTINENTFNVFIVDISGHEPVPLYRHESFQLWESQISAFYLQENHDYIMINCDGISLISLGTAQKRLLKSKNGQENMIHAIQSTDYLKCNKTNFIFFDFAGMKKEIHVEQQFQKVTKSGVETAYDPIFKLQIHKITLRELLFFQSLYVCSTQTEILKLVTYQPRPAVFYKSFLELDATNMASILAFDSRCMKYLLKEENAQFFNEDYPLFYKNKMVKTNNVEKYFYRSAIDMAIQANQLSAVSAILDYMVLHQNNYTSSYLFRSCFLDLIEKGVALSGVLESNVFRYQFDFDEWVSTHKDPNTYIKPFNKSLFDLRPEYANTFPELQEKEAREQEQKRCFGSKDEENQKQQSNKIFKIKYELNVLPLMFEHIVIDQQTKEKHFKNRGYFLMERFAECDELEVFRTKGITDNVDFKWGEYGKAFHLIGCIGHFGYMTLLFVYIGQIYVMDNTDNSTVFQLGLCAGLAYPAMYEFYKMYRLDFEEYISEPVQSLSNQLYIWCGIANVFQVLILGVEAQSFQCKILLTIILSQQIMKSFFYLRIFESLSYIVTMIFTVVADLQAFLLFFTLLVLVFGFIFAVIGAGNPYVPGAFKDEFGRCFEDPIIIPKKYIEAGTQAEYLEETDNFCGDAEIPNGEYEQIGLFLGYLFSTLRVAMGDFDFGASYYLSVEENILYFIMWVVVVILTCIIFLNFIIAEASASYQKVVDDLEPLIYQSKAHLIKEAEQIMPDRFKNENLFPRFIIIRSVDM